MRTRTIVIGVVALAVVATGAYVAKRLADGGKVTEVGVERALETFRSQIGSTSIAATTTAPPASPVPVVVTTSSAPPVTTPSATSDPATVPAPVLPAPGVYTYATTGYDEVDVLTGARHDYPATTTVTVTPNGCGVRLRWDVAVQRWDAWDWCLDGAGVRVVAWSGYHEFFGVGAQNDYVCTGDPRPLDADPGTTWAMVCRAGDRDTSAFAGTVVARTSVDVGGEPVPALHVRYDVEVTGASTGTQTIEGWYRTTDGLPLREVVAIDTSQDTPLGATRFAERSTVELTSLTPAS